MFRVTVTVAVPLFNVTLLVGLAPQVPEKALRAFVPFKLVVIV